jgi:hypothetical protein
MCDAGGCVGSPLPPAKRGRSAGASRNDDSAASPAASGKLLLLEIVVSSPRGFPSSYGELTHVGVRVVCSPDSESFDMNYDVSLLN